MNTELIDNVLGAVEIQDWRFSGLDFWFYSGPMSAAEAEVQRIPLLHDAIPKALNMFANVIAPIIFTPINL